MSRELIHSLSFEQIDMEPEAPVDIDLELVALAQAGDSDAFATLVARHQHLVYNLAFRFMREPSLAEDMAQEAFLKAFRLLKGFRGDCAFSTWMYRVTASVCLTELSKRKRRGEVPLLPVHEKCDDQNSTESSDLNEIMRSCVERLPERYARIVTLYYLKETPYEDIAHALQVPLGTLKTWMFRARKQLRRIVEEELRCHGTAQ